MRRFLIFFTLMMSFVTLASANILEAVVSSVKTVASSGSMWAGLAALALVYIFKAIPNARIYEFVSTFFNKLGVFMTLGLTKWKWSAPLWKSTIEPWFIDLFQNTVGAALNGFIAGLRSDNPPEG